MTTKSFVKLDYEGGVATLTLSRPPLNIMTIEMMEQMNSALLELRNQKEIKVLVVQGGVRAFSAGVDLREHTPDKVSRLMQVFHRTFETIRLLDVVAVAAVRGVALGGGFQLAIGCNLVVAAKSARFGVPEINLGLFPSIASMVLPRTTPRRKAMEWILTGDEIQADDLERYGLVNRVFADDQFEEGLRDFVGKIVSKSAPVLRLAKRAQTEAYYSTYEEALSKVENLYLRELMVLEDAKEGVTAFLEKRDPQWKDV